MSEYRACFSCGVPLETGEHCNCQRPAGAQRGLKVYCPYFGHRSSYRLKYYIVCEGGKVPFESIQDRDRHYQRYCCGLYGRCEICQGMMGGGKMRNAECEMRNEEREARHEG